MTDRTATPRQQIQDAIQRFAKDDLAQATRHLLDVLGYHSDRSVSLESNRPQVFLDTFDPQGKFNAEKGLMDAWQRVDLLFQLTDDDVSTNAQLNLLFESNNQIDNSIMKSYLFLCVGLREESYTRTTLATITREINKLFDMPVMVLYQHGNTLSFAVIDRRLNKQDSDRDVLEKVTLIKDIDTRNSHRAHIEILFDLSLAELHRQYGVDNFVTLHNAWRKALSASELNKRFFKEIANWYFWAVDRVTFPPDAGDDATRNATSVIRLITRLIFIWFLKEKGLVPDEIFNQTRVSRLLKTTAPDESSYYKAVLQNLFFATLNQEMGKRGFRAQDGSRSRHYNVTTLYRYADLLADPDTLFAYFENIPFLNGGLFECLDKKDDDGVLRRIDGFSDRTDNPLHVPNELFFGAERTVDLNRIYDTSGRTYRVRGIIDIFQRYKFTITENTPIEEEIALDPELLGQVFENLLAAYNPETATTARKQSGSFYTPREVVNFMVDEALITYLESVLSGGTRTEAGSEHDASDNDEETLGERLRHLFSYSDAPPQFSEAEIAALIRAIHNIQILDPACGSGAFPMGILQKLVFVLSRLDPHNLRWKQEQIEAARAIGDPEIRRDLLARIEQSFAENEMDYGRKLYLIENCIYGVDIQPIAVQIAKLRFFISLVVDQTVDDRRDNRGILPLPNLETKFVAANSLLKLNTGQMSLRSEEIQIWEDELKDIRRRHFTARTTATKEKYRQRDLEVRQEIKHLLLADPFLAAIGNPEEMADQLAGWNPYDPNTSADFFDAEWMFGITDGFDVVIGNPPYVRQERIKEYKEALQKFFPEVYAGTADLYVYFFAQGIDVLHEGGILSFITPNKFMRAGYGEKLRKYLSKYTSLKVLIDFGDLQVFDATTYPLISVIRKRKPSEDIKIQILEVKDIEHLESLHLYMAQADRMLQSHLSTVGWQLRDSRTLLLLDKLRSNQKLSAYLNQNAYRGLTTGLNSAFEINGQQRERIVREDPSSHALIKPWLRGKNVNRWTVEWDDLYVIAMQNSGDADANNSWANAEDERIAEIIFHQAYPSLHSHLLNFEDALRKRSDQGRFWWELRACAYYSEFSKPKIIWAKYGIEPAFAYDRNGYFGGNTVFILPTEDLSLVGILNSRVIQWYAQNTFNIVRGGYIEWIPTNVANLPIPPMEPHEKDELTGLTNTLVHSVHERSEFKQLERQIDQLVYRLFNLEDSEVEIIERDLQISSNQKTADFLDTLQDITGDAQ